MYNNRISHPEGLEWCGRSAISQVRYVALRSVRTIHKTQAVDIHALDTPTLCKTTPFKYGLTNGHYLNS